ncbi:mannan endo-1,6-alpha-mannosidase DCW1-like protein [Thermochaetoides thermophila DSM 1495]|uniref:Mannan endo-1,6-alpha-mannosidase n=1 Tax=Chaetomium thermophilum (strain DSM 1495 / CBS 144.50 / IMI 039719) TaxID=759272 RepID=G0SFA3_CHATD|nr:mannan endo-1,6-alpha-mannosidase DCW1-like protein [Thermochaetoides thermophila DSM 1495]EGS18119.1 mannan endo-1,6-alpha-mannosidase DCW1-like protein [Thermochaetoides thermophila DSM 1495]
MRLFEGLLFLALLVISPVHAIDLVLGDEASVKAAAKTIAFGMTEYYTGDNPGDVPGNLPDPYFWWEAGAMFGMLVEYWALTKDDTYNVMTMQALLHQATENGDFMPPNQTRTLGNDDQGFWGMAAMSAAEYNFPNPPQDKPQWLALAQSLFNQWATRWEESTCQGGLRWQIFSFNAGYNYKNSISNGCFFNIAARLARYTGNQTYAEWAARIWAWEEAIGLITSDYQVHDGVHINTNDNTCSQTDTNQWTYNAGIFLHGAAVMYNLTSNPIWRERVEGLLRTTVSTFFTLPENNTNSRTPVMHEQLCEPLSLCNIDQRSFKGYLTRWLANTAQLAPFTFQTIQPLLLADAAAAAQACTGSVRTLVPNIPGARPEPPFRGEPGTACGFRWTVNGFDGQTGVGEQMNALAAVMYSMVVDPNLSQFAPVPLTAVSGGTSKGDPSAGTSPRGAEEERKRLLDGEITIKDQVAAGFLTSAIVLGVVMGCIFVII